MKIHAGRNPWRSMVWLPTQRRPSSGCYPAWSWKPQCTDGECTWTGGGRLRCLYSCLEGGALLFGVLVYESQKNKVAILSQVLLTFLFTQTSSFLYLDEFRQAGNGGFIGARIQNHHFHQQCQLQLLKPHSPGALELPGKLKKRSKKNNSVKNMNLNSCVASQCCVLNIPTATWSKRHLSVELTALPTAPAPVCRARFYCLCSCATQTGQPGQKTVWC